MRLMEATEIKDIVEVSCREDPGFYTRKLKDCYSPAKHFDRAHIDKHYNNIAVFIARNAFMLAHDQMIDEGQELCFFDKARKPFIIMLYKDFRYVTKIKFKAKMKFRGAWTRLYVYIYPSLLRSSGMKHIMPSPEEGLYKRISKSVRKGMDYPLMPDIKIYADMKKPFNNL